MTTGERVRVVVSPDELVNTSRNCQCKWRARKSRFPAIVGAALDTHYLVPHCNSDIEKASAPSMGSHKKLTCKIAASGNSRPSASAERLDPSGRFVLCHSRLRAIIRPCIEKFITRVIVVALTLLQLELAGRKWT